jgi:predicted ester cyclase
MRHRAKEMTALVLTAVVLVGLASTFPATAQNATPAATACPAIGGEEVAALARRFAEEGHSNPAVHDELLADAVAFHRPVGTGILNKAEARRRAEELRAAFPDIRVTSDVVVVQVDTAVVAWTAEGTNRGELDGAAATERRATWEGISIVRVECGRIVEAWNSSDGLGYRRQLGIITDDELRTVGTPTVATPAP